MFIIVLIVGLLLFICWLIWEMVRVEELQIDVSMEDIESDLWNGLHLQERDK